MATILILEGIRELNRGTKLSTKLRKYQIDKKMHIPAELL
jgi:hypothetical protein